MHTAIFPLNAAIKWYRLKKEVFLSKSGVPFSNLEVQQNSWTPAFISCIQPAALPRRHILFSFLGWVTQATFKQPFTCDLCLWTTSEEPSAHSCSCSEQLPSHGHSVVFVMSLSQECQVARESTGWDVYCRSRSCQGNQNKPYKNILSFLFILDFWSSNYLIYQTWFI